MKRIGIFKIVGYFDFSVMPKISILYNYSCTPIRTLPNYTNFFESLVY